MLISTYIVERGLILEPCEVDVKTNEIKALPILIEKLALKASASPITEVRCLRQATPSPPIAAPC